ncbi:MAG TPA: ATP-binding protein [Gemmatimonadaceae bacterium]|nr:ATP-binding protein [Gemmatimonadaceae bacterium]
MAAPASLSLERKLPLLISVFLAALAVGLTAAGYREVKRATEARGIERLQRLTTQLAEVAGTSTQQRFAAMRRVAGDSDVVAYLIGAASDSSARARAIAALRDLSIASTDTVVVAELRPTTETIRVATIPEVVGYDEEPVAALIASMKDEQPVIGDLQFDNDSAYYWVGAPVMYRGRLLGHVLLRRTFSSSPRVEQQVRDLAGTDQVSIYLASDTRPQWASLSGKPTRPPSLTLDSTVVPNVARYRRADGRAYVAVFAHVSRTPFRIISEMPYDTLLERPSAFLRRSVVVAIAMLVIGIIAAWILSRRFTRPLRDLTLAADAISAGNYAHRAPVARRDEPGRLAEAFNTMAERVQRSHDDLERQIAESRMLAARLEEANRAKADFLATMSHELRTPLNAIGGYVDLIELGVRGPVTDDQRRDLGRVRFNQRHLLTVIGNILDFSRIDARKLSFELGDVHVDRVVHNVLTGVAPLLDEKSLRVECIGCDAPVVARADGARVEQILLNLLSNAMRFTPPNGTITVTLRPGDEVVSATVADTGTGIPPDKLAAIFEPFVQVDSGLTRTVGGTGLGLTISRALARGMGGDLVAESDGASWAMFTMTLPGSAADTEGSTDHQRLQTANGA